MENIFENAYFGKAYKTRDNRKAIYIKEKLVHESLSHTDVLYAQLVLETGDILEVVKEPGVSNGVQILYENLDIVSEWEKEIDEEHFDEFALEYTINIPCLDSKLGTGGYYIKGFKDGYKAAKKGE